MTAHEYAVLGWTLVGVAIGWIVGVVAFLLVQHRREQRAWDEAPTLPGALGGTSPEIELRLVEMFPPWDEDLEQWEAEMGRADS